MQAEKQESPDLGGNGQTLLVEILSPAHDHVQTSATEFLECFPSPDLPRCVEATGVSSICRGVSGGIQLGMCNSCLLLLGCLIHIEFLWLSPA